MPRKPDKRWESRFLKHYGETRNELAACELAKVPRQTVLDRRKKDKAFNQAFLDCVTRYEEGVRSVINARLKDKKKTDYFLVSIGKAVLPEWRNEAPSVTINNSNQAVIKPEEVVRKFRELAGIT